MASIRLATLDDAPEVARLLAQLPGTWDAKAPPTESLERWIRRLMDDPDTEFLLAGEPAVAAAQLRYRVVIWAEGEECELEDLFVEAEARGTGLGRALVEAGVERATARGCKRMIIVGNEGNTPAVGLYRALGFNSWFDPPGGHNVQLRRSL